MSRAGREGAQTDSERARGPVRATGRTGGTSVVSIPTFGLMAWDAVLNEMTVFPAIMGSDALILAAVIVLIAHIRRSRDHRLAAGWAR